MPRSVRLRTDNCRSYLSPSATGSLIRRLPVDVGRPPATRPVMGSSDQRMCAQLAPLTPQLPIHPGSVGAPSRLRATRAAVISAESTRTYGPLSDRRAHGPSGRLRPGKRFSTRADAMTRPLPRIPSLQCVRCGGGRFIPLTFPGLGEAKRSATLHPSAKCVTCGLCFFGSPTGSSTRARRP